MNHYTVHKNKLLYIDGKHLFEFIFDERVNPCMYDEDLLEAFVCHKTNSTVTLWLMDYVDNESFSEKYFDLLEKKGLK